MKSKSFGIGDASAIIDILRNRMYSKPIQTLVQEYICNARDAMIEAGTLGKTKIKVVAPTKLATQFRVRDFGVGLSEDRVQNIFTMYGNSTKRSSNNQIGGYGLGAKSAWAYTDSFTVVSYYNGTKTTYLCHVGKDNVGSMDTLNKETTKEPNGVEVIVTVKPEHVSEFTKACNRCLTLWDTNTYELNIGLTPVLSMNSYDDGFMLSTTDHEYSSNVWVSNVWVSVDDILFTLDFGRSSNVNTDTLFKCKTGDVDIAPSRETVIDNDKLKKFKAKCLAHIKAIQAKYEAMTLEDKIKNQSAYGLVIQTKEIKIDSNYTLLHGGYIRVNKDHVKRLTNKVGNVDYSSITNKIYNYYFDLPLTKTYLIVCDDGVSFAPSKLEHYFSGKSFGKHEYCISVKDLNLVPKFLHDQFLSIIDVSTLPNAPKLCKQQRTITDNVKVLSRGYGGDVCGAERSASTVNLSNFDFKFPYNGFKDNSDLNELLRRNYKAIALKKDDYESSTLPTMEEFIESIAIKQRKLIGNLSDETYAFVFKKFTDEDSPVYGKSPIEFFLTEDERKQHSRLRETQEKKVEKLIKKYPLLIYVRGSHQEKEFIEYVQLKKGT